MKILIVDDDHCISEVLVLALTQCNYVVDTAPDAETGWDLIQQYPYNLIILDIILPRSNGLTLCQRVRQSGYSTPILLLTGRGSGSEKVQGLNGGADDYVVKPFDLEELLARVRVLLRRSPVPLVMSLAWEGLRLDPSSCEVTYANQPLQLTPKEYKMLELFLRNPQRVFNREEILHHLWSADESPSEATVTTHMMSLRHKLKAVGSSADLIETVYGLGYRLKALALQ
jgi:DNA-binding response OmpR family regulator